MLSPWLQPSAINSPLQAAGALKIGGYDSSGSLDKRNNGDPMGLRNQINDYKTIAETITNALGNRSPYYVIGEIPWSSDSWWGKNISTVTDFLGEFGGAVRAVSDLFTGKKQEGVIIDCLGDVKGESTVEFTSNPVLYTGSQISNGRMRKPTIVDAVVAVSNYNNDSALGLATDVISTIDPSGLIGNAIDLLASSGNTRAQTALYNLRWLQENGEPFKVYTPHGMYENMLIEKISPITDAKSMDMLYAHITFREMIFAQPYYTSAKGAKSVPVRETVISTKDRIQETIGSNLSDIAGRMF